MLKNVTFAERFGAVPGAVFGADEGRGPVSVHGETRRTLETDCTVVGEITSQPHPIGWNSWVTTVDDCRNEIRQTTFKWVKQHGHSRHSDSDEEGVFFWVKCTVAETLNYLSYII